jgi:hypothetical protein
LLNLFLPPGA